MKGPNEIVAQSSGSEAGAKAPKMKVSGQKARGTSKALSYRFHDSCQIRFGLEGLPWIKPHCPYTILFYLGNHLVKKRGFNLCWFIFGAMR